MITTIIDGYIVAYQSQGDDDKDYQVAIKVMKTRPTPPQGYDYRLRAEDLTWELYELPQESMEGEGDETE